MKKKGFTLVELLVVIAIIALLMGILMPALARVRMIANRMVCGSNMSGIGKALLLYAGDSAESYPMPGYQALPVVYAMSGHIDTAGPYWDGHGTATQAFMGSGTSGGNATIGSLLYMLIKYEDVSPKQFNCKGDSGAEVFKLTTYTTTTQTDVTKCYDFGSYPGKHNSYAYHFPFAKLATGNPPPGGFPVSVNNKPSCPLAGDRNPGLDKNASTYIVGSATAAGGTPVGTPLPLTPYGEWTNNNNEYKDKDLVYNAYPHQREGQNVLYNDGHVKFETTANVGVDNDNIYQRWPTPYWADPAAGGTSTKPPKREREAGGYLPAMNASTPPQPASYAALVPGDVEDALLVNECK